MKKYDNYVNSLEVLKKADFNRSPDDEIYRMGIIGQFQFTFELAWKALQEVLQMHAVSLAGSGSPREILKAGYEFGFVEDSETWLLMLKKRNISTHVYNEEEADELVVLIRDSFLPAFLRLSDVLSTKIQELEENWG